MASGERALAERFIEDLDLLRRLRKEGNLRVEKPSPLGTLHGYLGFQRHARPNYTIERTGGYFSCTLELADPAVFPEAPPTITGYGLTGLEAKADAAARLLAQVPPLVMPRFEGHQPGQATQVSLAVHAARNQMPHPAYEFIETDPDDEEKQVKLTFYDAAGKPQTVIGYGVNKVEARNDAAAQALGQLPPLPQSKRRKRIHLPASHNQTP